MVSPFASRSLLLLIALLAASGAVWGMLHTAPFGNATILLTLMTFACVLAQLCWPTHWPAPWLILIPALLPVIDQVKYTGQIFFTAADLFVLVILAAACLRTACLSSSPDVSVAKDSNAKPVRGKMRRGKLPLTLGFYLIVSALVASTIFSTWYVFKLNDPLQLAAYHSQWNGLRVAKALLFSLLFIPLIKIEFRRDGRFGVRGFSYGLCLGLAAVAVSALLERLTYVSLADFASDYRITASFWEMNVGGAALDGFLVLALPFAAWLAFTTRSGTSSKLSTMIGWCLLLLGSYALLVTFTRTTYLAALVMAAIIGLGLMRQHSPGQGLKVKGLGLLGLLLFGGVAAMFFIFEKGGYRTMAALLGVIAASHYLGTQHGSLPSRSRMGLLAVMLASGLVIISLLASLFFSKGSYLAFVGLSLVFAAMVWQQQRQPDGERIPLLTAVWFSLLIAAGLIAQHWGGNPALLRYVPVASVIALGMVALRLRASRLQSSAPASLWRWNPQAAAGVLAISTMLGLAVAVMSNYQMDERFSQVRQSWTERTQHWTNSLNLLREPQGWLWGLGVGSYPYQYLLRAPDRLIPGTMRFQTEAGQHFVRLTSNHTDMGFFEMLRLMQPVPITEIQRPTLLFRVRTSQDVKLNFEVCARQLIYTDECLTKEIVVNATGGQWRDLSMQLDRGELRPGSGLRRWTKDYYFALAIGSTAKSADITDVQLIGQSGQNLLRNSSFNNGSDQWFITSDRNHLPWHAKNLFLHLLIEQGVFGLVAFSALLLAVLVRTYKYRHGWEEAPYFLAALVGFIITGLFDSLLDVPRVAFLFYLLCWMIFLRPGSLRSTS